MNDSVQITIGSFPKPIATIIRFFTFMYQFLLVSIKISKFKYVAVNIYPLMSRKEVIECGHICDKAMIKYTSKRKQK